MKFSVLTLSIACSVACSLGADEVAKQVPIDPPPGAYEVAPFRYVLTQVVNNDGSVTQVGTLSRDGVPVAGSDFYRLELPIGSFIWYPSKPSEHSPGDQIGWIRIAPLKKYSRWEMALIEPNPPPNAKLLRTVQRAALR
jgi:hypothetical protein